MEDRPAVNASTRENDRHLRLGVIASHPIQYQSPLWRGLVEFGLDAKVIFLAEHGRGVSVDRDFGRTLAWDVDLLSGFDHLFVRDLFRRAPGAFLTGANPALISVIVRGRFDALLVNGYSLSGCLIATMAAKVFRIPVYFRGETLSREARRTMGELSSGPWRDRLLRALMSLYVGAFAIGDDSRNFFLELGVPAERITIARYGVENPRFGVVTAEEIAAYRADLGIETAERVILFVGKLIERKRPTHVLSVTRALRRRGIAARAIIVGSGRLSPAISDMLDAEDIHLGFLNQSQMPRIYAAADVILVPSSYETWGLVVNEALAAGTPVVASPTVPSAVEIADRDARVVRIVNSLNVEQWADSCIALLSQPRHILGQQTKAVVAKYDLNEAAAAIAARLKEDLSTMLPARTLLSQYRPKESIIYTRRPQLERD